MSPRPPEIKIHTHTLSLVQDPERVRSAQRGELIHLALFFLDHCAGKKDIERAILQAFALRGVDRNRWDIDQDYLKPLTVALSLPDVRVWFERGVVNLREVEVIDAQSELHRIDRLIIGDDMLNVVDFKMGRREDGHRDQVDLYKRLVKAVFHRPAEGHILYIDEPAVIPVP